MENKLFVNKRSFEFVSNPGSPEKPIYHGKVLPSGEIELVYDGVENIQEYIDSFEQETNIENIITRVNNGEIDLLHSAAGAYMDTVGMPKTYAEILQTVIDGQRTFEMLPIEIKEKFGNDFNQWFAQMGNDDFMEKSGFIKKKDPDPEPAVDTFVKKDGES